MRWKTLAVAAVALLLAACGQQKSEKTFKFTAIPDQNQTQLVERFSKVADYLQKKLGVPVKYVPVKSYPASVTAFRNNEVQMAWFGGLTGVQARRLVPGSKAIAQGEEDATFRCYFIANTSTGLQRADKLPAAFADQPSFTFGAKTSTSGRLMPEYWLRQRFGKAPDKIFPKIGYSGDHNRTLALVQSGAYATGALNYEVWDRAMKEGKIDTSKVRVIWETPPFPDYQWTVRGDLDKQFGKGFTDKVQQALLDIKDPKLLNAFPRSKFIPTSNADYKPIAKTAEQIGLLDKSGS